MEAPDYSRLGDDGLPLSMTVELNPKKHFKENAKLCFKQASQSILFCAFSCLFLHAFRWLITLAGADVLLHRQHLGFSTFKQYGTPRCQASKITKAIEKCQPLLKAIESCLSQDFLLCFT